MNWLTLGLEIAAGWWLCGFVATGFYIAHDKATDPDSWTAYHAWKLRFFFVIVVPLFGAWALFELFREGAFRYGWTLSAKPVSLKDHNLIDLPDIRVSILPSRDAEIVMTVNHKPVTIYSGPWPATREALLASYTSIIADGLEAE